MKAVIAIALFAFTLFASLSALAALPPWAESLRQYRAILDNREVLNALGNSWLNSIESKENGIYLLHTRGCVTSVKVESVMPEDRPVRVGPPELKISVVDTICLPN